MSERWIKSFHKALQEGRVLFFSLFKIRIISYESIYSFLFENKTIRLQEKCICMHSQSKYDMNNSKVMKQKQ